MTLPLQYLDTILIHFFTCILNLHQINDRIVPQPAHQLQSVFLIGPKSMFLLALAFSLKLLNRKDVKRLKLKL